MKAGQECAGHEHSAAAELSSSWQRKAQDHSRLKPRHRRKSSYGRLNRSGRKQGVCGATRKQECVCHCKALRLQLANYSDKSQMAAESKIQEQQQQK